MKPTVDKWGTFVNRSICGSANLFEKAIAKKESNKKDGLKQLLIKINAESRKSSNDPDQQVDNATKKFDMRSMKHIETSKKGQLKQI